MRRFIEVWLGQKEPRGTIEVCSRARRRGSTPGRRSDKRRRASRRAGCRHARVSSPRALGCPGCAWLGSAWGGGARGVTASAGGSVLRADASASVVLSRRAAWTGQVVRGIARWAWQHLFSVYLRGRLLSVKFVFYFSIFSTVWIRDSKRDTDV